MGNSLKVECRLPPKSAEWFTQRLADTKKTKSELLQEIVADRIELEANPFGFLAKKKAQQPTKKINGYNTLIPDFTQKALDIGVNV